MLAKREQAVLSANNFLMDAGSALAKQAVAPPASPYEQAFRLHRESVLSSLARQDEWDAACPYFIFKLTQNASTGAWETSAAKAAVGGFLTFCLSVCLGSLAPSLSIYFLISYLFFFFSGAEKKKKK